MYTSDRHSNLGINGIMESEMPSNNIRNLSVLLALSACLAVVWMVESDNWKKGGERNGGATMMVDERPMLKLRAESTSAVNKVVSRSPQTIKVMKNVQSVRQILPLSVESAICEFAERQTNSSVDVAQQASDLNDVMDEMLKRSEIPADYAETMVALFRDRSQGDVIRDFAVQHIGLYAETLQMHGKYDADASESAMLRNALWDAAEETRTIVAVAAFRALADMAAFDPRIDVNRLDSRLASCVSDSAASPAARVMAAQLCGECRVAAAKLALARIAADRCEPDPLRLAAANSARFLAE